MRKNIPSLCLVSSVLFICNNAIANNDCNISNYHANNISVAINSAINNFNNKNANDIHKYISESRYIQHVPNGKDGSKSLANLIGYMKSNMPTFEVKNVRSIAENDLVLTQSIDYLKGKPIEISYDWYRINDGKITEHWDVVNELPKDADPLIYTSGHNLDVTSCLDKEKIRSIALDYFYTTWSDLDSTAIKKHLSSDFVQHNPAAIVGGKSDKDALIDLVSELKKSGSKNHIDISKVIVMGDFAAIHAKWSDGKEVLSVTDVLRFDNNYKIVEHWDGLKAIPRDNINNRDAVF
ncbi:nuclear transport factor 2 family protein [Serratia sp. DD3]|uniref:nuclear transport factor 2 family protein n=1 Tax=Serratia sp. DD3 TaxID=1410619 RepID=UPI0004D41DD1|nr:nuclear transport factor 2 family protein [Serratia sp. DD3]KEY60005.1 putative ester cyclase [Serratia sp. DD3]